MNDPWAIVIGAVIALAGSVATPWIRESIERKRRIAEIGREDARNRNRELGIAIHNFMEALVEQFAGKSATTTDVGLLAKQTLMTSLDLGLLLEIPDMAIATILSSAGAAVSTESDEAIRAMNSLTSVLPAWRRGQATAWEALDAYREQTGLIVVIEDESRYRSSPTAPRRTSR